MSNLACIAHRCALPRRHAEGCTNDTCRGCLPALAQDGLRLCPLHTTRISTDALRIAELDHEIEEVLARSGRVGERTSGTADHGTVLNDRAVEVRTEIRHTLVAWCRLVAEERGIHLPPNHLDAMAAYLATHHVWLAAHKTANDSSDELSSLARRAYSAAYPNPPIVVRIGHCPKPDCPGELTALVRQQDSMLPSGITCSWWDELKDKTDQEPHQWSADQWHALGRQMARRTA